MRGVDAPHGQWHAFVARERNEGRVWRGDSRKSRGDARNARGAFPECENAGKRVFRSGRHGRPPTLPGYTDAPPSRGDTRKPDRGYTETL